MKRKICVITGSRAEYGLLMPLMEEIKKDSGLKLQLVVTGMHLSAEFGFTYREIEKDGFTIDAKVKNLSDSDMPVDISKAMALAMRGCAEAYEKLSPDIIVVLGDRFDMFSAVAAAHVARIPVAHLYGGEVTEGAFDDAFRHSITKISQLHFTSTEIYRRRVVQLGESPDRVFTVGALGLDNIKNLRLLSKKAMEQALNFSFNKRNLLVTFHSVTLENNTSQEQFKNLLDALDGLKDTNIIFTKTNADTHGRTINKMIDIYVSKNTRKAAAFTSLGQLRYLSTLQFVNAVVGNSSSGIVEAPSFKIGTINIGDRQKGRIRAKSVIDCGPLKHDIRRALKKLYSKEFQAALKTVINPYGDGRAAKRIKNVLKSYDLKNILKKSFHDLDFACRR